ncbi:MAG: carboxypeptidase-like regulatory domain-containing protein, partial [Schleiferiaceae bacterium]|nr:carboxypeptidase-like regulatory domain-containing protein [Schleiferiaceae bacterium]
MHKNYLKLLIVCFSILSYSGWAQVISGVVLDENKQPMPTVAVKIEGTNINTLTDFDGKYVLEGVASGEQKVSFSIMGYQTTTKTVSVISGQPLILNVDMKVDKEELDEVVVVGYGVKRKNEVTNSIVQLETKDLTDIPTPSFENGIMGKASGVQVITGSGIAGSGSMVRVRGVASISAGGDPLYVVDGVIINQDYFANGNGGGFNTNPLATINPNDIENVTILKDAAATGIYGSRGSNGVILITTKRGSKKGLNFDFNVRVGVTNPTARPNMLNSQEYLRLYEEAWVNDGNVGVPVLPGSNVSWEQAQNVNTNWVDETIRTGFKQKYDFGVGKGADKYNWYAGVSYQNDNSYLKGNSYDRINGRFNIDYKLSSQWELGVSSSIALANNNRIDAAWSGGLGSAMSTALPIYPIYWDKDTVDQFGNPHQKGDYWLLANINNNPVAQRELKEWNDREIRTINNFSVTYRPGSKTFIKAFGGLDYMHFTGDVYEKPGFDMSNTDPNT